MTRIELENKLSQASRKAWGDNAVEALVGAISSITTEKQLETLLNYYEKESQEKEKERER